MIGGKALDRVVAVLGKGQGSGVLLDRRTVLTALHVVEGCAEVRVAHPWSEAPVPCSAVRSDKEHDIALLVADLDVISAEQAAPLGPLRIGEVATQLPLPDCQIVGFPQVQRYDGEELEFDQYRATVLPMAGQQRGLLVCELDAPAAQEDRHGATPLQGLSGAPVFAGPVLLGIVTQVPRRRLHHRIEAAPLRAVRSAGITASLGSFFEEITEVHPEDERFEVRYAADLSSQYRRTEIFGIDELGRGESRWDLDTAYLTLDADGPRGTTRQRIDTLLPGRRRVLLRGEAGAGKTTLVWWLAAHAANSTLGEYLAGLNGLVPFVVPLREVHARGGRFPAVSELLSAGRGITGGPPEGWADRVLSAGRGLLLVDGLDEVPEREREQARRWLTTLLDRYPRTRCLATVRPNAVEKNWLTADGFDELVLLPMSDEDIRAFVRAWHNAARLECERVYDARPGRDEREHLTTLEQGLIRQLDENIALGDLARTPLLCAVICALHRRRGGLLPTTRFSLYRAALAMLLGGRDAGRGVVDADRIRIDSDEQHILLQRIAIWLVRTGQQQMTRAQAVQQLDLAMRDMPPVRDQGTPEDVLRFLLNRSGLLHERADDALQFIHRTFQDFLAAKEFHESGYVLELLKHAGDEAYRDLIVLAVGHATRRDAQEIVEQLVAFGDAAEDEGKRTYLRLLAAWCAIGCLSLDAGLTERVRERLGALMPPVDRVVAVELQRLGDWVVGLLPAPETLDATGAVAVAEVLLRIRTRRARQALRAFAPLPACASVFSAGWDLYPADEYAREVLAGLHLPFMRISSLERLEHLPLVASVAALAVDGPFQAEELDTYLPTDHLGSLCMEYNEELQTLDFLRKRTDLRVLEVYGCPYLTDVSALADLRLDSLLLGMRSLTGAQVAHLSAIRGLTSLELVGTPRDGWTGLTPHPDVRRLNVESDDPGWLTTLPGWTSLEELRASGPLRDVPALLRALSEAPRVSGLVLRGSSFGRLAGCPPIPHVRSLHFYDVQDHADTAHLRRVFPGLHTLALRLNSPAYQEDPLDLRPLSDLPGLRIELRGSAPVGLRVLGQGHFADRLDNRLNRRPS